MAFHQYPRACQLMREHGFAVAIVEYSGGNDSGGADVIHIWNLQEWATKLDAEELYRNQEVSYHDYMERIRGLGVVLQEYQGNAKYAVLVEALVKPVYDRYGSFAGEYDCGGKLTYLADADGYEQEGWETVTSYEDGTW